MSKKENPAPMEERQETAETPEEVTEEFRQEAISPIISEGDVIGAVILLNNAEKGKMGEVEQKLILSAAGFLGRQMEQ